MQQAEVALILMLLKIACPHLKKMAEATDNPIDDLVVNIICSVAALDEPPDIP